MFSVLALSLYSFLCFISGVSSGGENLEYKKVHLVNYHEFDDGSMNYLFRGNSPIVNGTEFAYDTLVEYFEARCNEQNLSFPSNYNFYFVDISFDNDLNGKDWQIERHFWNKKGNNTSFGELIHWPIGLAGIVPPTDVSYNEQMQLCQSKEIWDFDMIPGRINMTQTIFLKQNKYNIPTVIYTHCIAGCDRTGEFIASYRLQYEWQNITKVYDMDATECGYVQYVYYDVTMMLLCM